MMMRMMCVQSFILINIVSLLDYQLHSTFIKTILIILPNCLLLILYVATTSPKIDRL